MLEIQPDTGRPILAAVFDDDCAAERALRRLERSGVDPMRISVVARQPRSYEHPVGLYDDGERVRVWGASDALWVLAMERLPCAGLFFIPEVGHVACAGPFVRELVDALDRAALFGERRPLRDALTLCGVAPCDVPSHERAIEADRFLVLVHDPGTAAAVATDILAAGGAELVGGDGA